MRILRSSLMFFIVMSLCCCSSDSWFGANKKLDMPGERIPLVVRSKDLVVTKAKTNLSIPKAKTNLEWNGTFNQFPNNAANLSWNFKAEPSKSLTYSEQTFLVQASFPSVDSTNLVAMSSDGVVHSYDLASGQEIWSNPFFSQEESRGFFDIISNKFLIGGLKRDGNVIYVTAGLAKVIAIDAADGHIIWNAAFSSPIRSVPLVIGDLLILQSIDNKVYALNKSDGNSVWTYISNHEDLNSLSVSSPLESGKSLIVKFSNDEVIAIDKLTGEEIWSNGLVNQQNFGLIARSVFNNNSLTHLGKDYLVTSNSKGNIFKINLETGDTIWNKDVAATSKSWLVGDVLLFISNANDLVSLNMQDGNVAWIVNLSKQDEDGKAIVDLYVSNPVVADGYVYVSNNKGDLMQINMSNGEIEQTTKIPENSYLGPIFANGKMFIISNDGEISIY
ncbi:MAG: enzyme repeat family protein [Candidatus Midichloriaceae bacterium]|jgi:outer membrane protein assembly factor BamB|nr:enzyme repeat family protein [Candidatus Midichloriaceae bacterium]